MLFIQTLDWSESFITKHFSSERPKTSNHKQSLVDQVAGKGFIEPQLGNSL